MSLLKQLETITDPTNAYYYPTQLVLFGGITYLSTICFTSLSLLSTVPFMMIAYTIDQFITPHFCHFFESQRQTPLMPFIGQSLHLFCSALASKVICSFVFPLLSLSQMIQIGGAFLCTLYVCKFIFLQFLHSNFRLHFFLTSCYTSRISNRKPDAV